MIQIAKMEHLSMVTQLANALFPCHSMEELREEMREFLTSRSAMIAIYFEDNDAVAFAQCQLRHDYVEGTKSSPVGYLEGIYVEESRRRKGIAVELLECCEKWAAENGCTEFASDCEMDNLDSYHFHLSVGFAEANRIICFHKEL